ncbi:MerR family DNA-binding transcriptional regulator [Paenibacillus sp. OV219]|uniref:MerR family DNA-binding transcriptional regulator n=1 Tax=Paenibacillus sp. OV219 TaxID=1884377 RepID=UPI0008CDD85B|nr:MerR family regulatory protein [Paenibacillus sp. OV219]
MEGLISIGQLSADVGVSIRALRYYEEVSRLQPSIGIISAGMYDYRGSRTNTDAYQIVRYRTEGIHD